MPHKSTTIVGRDEVEMAGEVREDMRLPPPAAGAAGAAAGVAQENEKRSSREKEV